MKKYLLLSIFAICVTQPLFSQNDITSIDNLIEKGKYDQATKQIKEYFTHDSSKNRLDYYFYLGEINKAEGKYDIAIDYVDRALDINPNSPAAMDEMGLLSAAKGDTNNGLIMLTQAIKLDTGNASFSNDKGTLYVDMKKYSLAIPCFLKAFKSEPEEMTYLYNLGGAYNRIKKYDSTVYYLTMALKKNKYRLLYFERAQAYTNLGKTLEAVQDFNKALALKKSKDPFDDVDDATLIYQRAQVWKASGNTTRYNQDMALAKKNGYKEVKS